MGILPLNAQIVVALPSKQGKGDLCVRPRRLSPKLRAAALLLAPALLLASGCTSLNIAASSSTASFSIAPGISSIDTNCTGCNAIRAQGTSVEQFTASLPGGSSAAVNWKVSGGDRNSGPGTITAAGQYTPPSYLTADRVQVLVTATFNATTTATTVLTVTPGFLQPLTPENAALGPNGQTTITGFVAEAGGETGISFALANSASSTSGGQGSLGATTCQRGAQAFTYCTVVYTAPSAIAATGVTYVVATIGSSNSRANAELLLNTAGVASTPASHQAQLPAPVQMGSSGGNNFDYDTQGNQIADCCGGTLGSLVEDGSGHQYLLSNNHVLARSDQASVGDPIVQPGLIDNNCLPWGEGPGTTSIGSLTSWLPLSAASTNADAAIALVTAGTVDTSGSILELGTRQPDGALSAAPPGISSTGGKGESPSLNLMVAKSGRTTGLTCASISAVALDVNVDYFTDCAETRPYLTKSYTNQLAIAGNQFSDAGDSGSLVVDTANAEPVGLFFAGGTDAAGVSQGIANPASEVLKELGVQAGGAASYSFVGTADHAVSCLNYGDNSVAAVQTRTLSNYESVRSQLALAQARSLINPVAGILGVATGKSTDRPGEGAVILYVDENLSAAAPATVEGVRTLVIPTNSRAVALGSAPQTPLDTAPAALPAAVLNAAVARKQQLTHNLMLDNPAFFGVGVGQSLDSPKEAALVIYVDRKKLPSQLPATVSGMRTRYVVMDRLHVTRSWATPFQSRSHCMTHPALGPPASFNPLDLAKPQGLHLN